MPVFVNSFLPGSYISGVGLSVMSCRHYDDGHFPSHTKFVKQQPELCHVSINVIGDS